MLKYVRKLFTKPTEIYTARNMKTKDYIRFILLMGVVLTFLSFFDLKNEFNLLSEDFQEIQKSIPDYNLVNDKLESDQESFIYQTDSLVFYFDPDNKIDTDLINKNMEKQSAPISAALQKEKVYLNILGEDRSLEYSELDLSSQDLQSIISAENFSNPLYFIIILSIFFLFNLFLYLTQLLSISIFANLISSLRRSRLSLFQNAKIALIASIVPSIIIEALNSFNLTINYQFEIIMLASLTLFYMTISEFKKRLKKQKNE